ncbi:MAG: hypothetical protein DRO16_04905 [Thermoprotei archaeon]|nr:MAG: hypothetical protein DRO16_04905 [Thermoprotei archaeon]
MNHDVLYLNLGGIEFYVFKDLLNSISIEHILEKKTSDWKYVILKRRIISFANIFRIISEYCIKSRCYTRLYFYELRYEPIDVIIDVLDKKTFIIVSTNIPLSKVLKRIVSNPRFSESIIFITPIEKGLGKEIYDRMDDIKTLSKLYRELFPILFTKRLGKLVGIHVRKTSEGKHDIKLCVTKEDVSVEFQHKGLKMKIVGINRCI